VKLGEREEARRLRREEGLAIRVIAERLGVAKSSVSAWTRDISLTEEQHERLRQANPIYNQQLRGQEGRRASARAVRLAAQEHGREVARRGDPLHLLGCHLNNGLSLDEIETWWLAQLELPITSLRTATVNRPSSASRWRRNVYVYGTASVRVDSTFLVQSIYGAIQEYGGFERPAWLD
jgi:transcriptional regulator with XRE-family HTH domain